jgi:hypothetical protein
MRGSWFALLVGLVGACANACANPGGAYSDVASATIGDPGVDGGIAGNVSVENHGCSLPTSGVYATAYVEQPGGTCGPVADGYVNGASLSAAPFCPHGKGSVTDQVIPTDGGATCFVALTLKGCAVSPTTTVSTTGETGTWSSDYATFTGSTTVSATAAGTECASSYNLTFTRQ